MLSLSLSCALQARVFVNQLYKPPVEVQLEINPDLQAIRFASFNPILDPWIYILLRKAVLLKLIEKITCLFCKIGARRQRREGNCRCMDAHHLSSVSSKRDSVSVGSRDLRNVTSSSQSVLCLPEGSEVSVGGCLGAERLSVTSLRCSCSSERCSSEAQRGPPALPCPKDPALQVSLSTEAVEEKCI